MKCMNLARHKMNKQINFNDVGEINDTTLVKRRIKLIKTGIE